MSRSFMHLMVLASLGLGAATGADAAGKYEKRWVYSMYNLQVSESADEVVRLIDRASKAGYNGVVLADYKLNILDRVPDHYFKHVARVRDAANRAKIELIPAVCPIGYSAGLLAHDPNLAEGLLAENTPFVARNGEAAIAASPTVRVKNGDLEETKADVFMGFGFQDDPGKATFADREVVHHGRVSCRMQDPSKNSSNGNCRLIQKVQVRPRGCYRFSCWVKTKNLERPGDFHLTVIGAGPNSRQLSFHEGGLESTTDWRQVGVVFNSLDQKEVNLYAGVWGGGAGALWLDELKVEELGLTNVLRREGCPLTVNSDDGRVTYIEGKDFAPIRDVKLGQIPFSGEYEFDHAGPTIQIPAGSRIKNGSRLLVSWYHPVPTHGTQIMCCLTEPKVFDILRDQMKRVESLLHPKTYFLGYDEIRVANWCASCQARHSSAGTLLADHVSRAIKMIKQINPRSEVVVWSDMFDPNHNAVDQYYLVNGSLQRSWEGLPSETIIANWNSGKAAASLRFFADRGHRQVLAGYYDADDLSGFENWDKAARGVKAINGYMYTTWAQKYRLLETYGQAIRSAK
jgi:Glycosyl hydrolase family 20, catalytic domain